MKYYKFYIFVLILCMFQVNSFAQNLEISGDFGVSFKTNSYANGYGFNINATFLHFGKHHFGLTIGNNFMSSSNFLPGKNLEEYNFHLRDYTNIIPLGEESFNFGWSIEAFDQIRLRSQPNRYYNFNGGINYYYEFGKLNGFRIGSEWILTYRDQMEIAKVLNVKELVFWIPLGQTINDYNIPIYSYDTYIDIGFAPYIQYNIFNYKRLGVDIKSKIYIFPKSGEMIYYFGTVLSWKKSDD